MNGLAVLEPTDPRWASLVAGHPAATMFHHPVWARLVATCCGFGAFAVAGPVIRHGPLMLCRATAGALYRYAA